LTACASVIAATFLGYGAQPIAIHSIHVYQRTIAPVADRIGARCRFTPSCSHYAEIVIARDGLVRGGWKAVKRIARCGPWTPPGTSDNP
jgi:putative membrane protein insertion efficiency factor